jgi:hypothetical protein
LQLAYKNINNGYIPDANNKDSTEERTAPMTFAGWDVQGSQEVRCSQDQRFATSYSANPIGKVVNEANKGGLYSCNASLGIRNVQLINRFLQEWAGDEDTVTQGGVSNTGIWPINPQHFSVMADTWAMKTVVDVNPGDGGAILTKRVQAAYEGSDKYMQAHTKAYQLAQKGQSADVLDATVITQDAARMGGDDTKTAEVGFSKSANPNIDGYESSPWNRQAASGTYQSAYNARQRSYMGGSLP